MGRGLWSSRSGGAQLAQLQLPHFQSAGLLMHHTYTAASSTARGFEPLRAEPNGFLVHHLNHSVTLSMKDMEQVCPEIMG